MNDALTDRLRQLSELEPGWYANVGKRTGEKCCATMREAAERITTLEATLRDVRAAIMEHAPDTLWVSLIETAVDRIDADLGGDVPEFAG